MRAVHIKQCWCNLIVKIEKSRFSNENTYMYTLLMNIDIRIVEAIVLKLGDDYLNKSNIYLSYV